MVKLKIYSIPNPTPKSIMHLLYSFNLLPPLTTTCSARHNRLTTTKPSYPRPTRALQAAIKLPNTSTSNNHYGGYARVKICSLTTASPKPMMNALPSPRTTPTMQSAWQLIPPMHNGTNQLLGLPNVAKLWPTAWVPCSIEPLKSLTTTNMSVLPSKTKYTYLMPLQPLVSC